MNRSLHSYAKSLPWFRPRSGWCFAGVVLALLVSCATAPRRLEHPQSPTLAAFQERLEYSRSHLDPIIRAAEAAADRVDAHPAALLDVPDRELRGWPDEFINRAGGLANCAPARKRRGRATPNDIALMAVRSWERDLPVLTKMLERSRQQGQMVILFASRAGMPATVKADYLIDNGAPSGDARYAPANAIANLLNGWLWTCEYAAALTRYGRYPGVLESIALPNAKEFDDRLQTPAGRSFLGKCKTPIAPGTLSGIYLKRVDRLLGDLRSAATRQQIDRAADVIARQLDAGGTVWIGSCDHMLMAEIFMDRHTPMKPLRVPFNPQAIPDNVHGGDLFVWIGYRGMGTGEEDYATPLRKTGAKIVASYIPDPNPQRDMTEALAIIPQHWTLPDAEVPVPFSPGFMAPVSGLDQSLLYRMLEASVAQRLPAAVVALVQSSLVPISHARFADGGAYGAIRDIGQDKYGNLHSTFVEADFERLGIKLGQAFTMGTGGKSYRVTYGTWFSDVPQGDWICLLDDDDYYVFAINSGNSAQATGAQKGDPIFIRKP